MRRKSAARRPSAKSTNASCSSCSARSKSEVGALEKTHDEQAESIAGFAQLSAHEATRANQNPESLQHSVQGLRSSVDGFEKSHPKLVQIVNAISNTLSNLGI